VCGKRFALALSLPKGWSLDVSFNEDQSRARKGFAGENLAVTCAEHSRSIRHLTLNLLKQEKGVRSGIAAKRKRAGWDNRYLEKLLALAWLPAL